MMSATRRDAAAAGQSNSTTAAAASSAFRDHPNLPIAAFCIAHVDAAPAKRPAPVGESAGIEGDEQAPCRLSATGRPPLALRARMVQIGGGRLAKDVPLANRVRSGRKQP